MVRLSFDRPLDARAAGTQQLLRAVYIDWQQRHDSSFSLEPGYPFLTAMVLPSAPCQIAACCQVVLHCNACRFGEALFLDGHGGA